MDTLVDSPAVDRVTPGWDTALPEADWERARERYVTGERLTVIADELGVSYETAVARSVRGSWAELRQRRKSAVTEALVSAPAEMQARAMAQAQVANQTDYLAQVAQYRETAGVMQREHDRLAEMLNDDGLESAERVALTQCLVRVSERLQRCLSIPDVKPVELRASGTERRVAAVPVG